jgi:uncharacterized Zn finger protein (UPF0148 family)
MSVAEPASNGASNGSPNDPMNDLASRSSSDAPTCPKCGAVRTAAATACPACGLAVERMASFATELEATVPDIARAAWERARASWEEPAAHDELLRLVTLHGCYAWAATRYRQIGPDDPIAARQLTRVRKAAEAALVTSASPRPAKPGPYRSTLYVLGVLILALLLGMAYASYVRGRGGGHRSPALAPQRVLDHAPGRAPDRAPDRTPDRTPERLHPPAPERPPVRSSSAPPSAQVR